MEGPIFFIGASEAPARKNFINSEYIVLDKDFYNSYKEKYSCSSREIPEARIKNHNCELISFNPTEDTTCKSFYMAQALAPR